MEHIMEYRRLWTIILIMTFGITLSHAKKNPEDHHAFVTLSDGKIIEGYISTSLVNYLKPNVSKIDISEEFEGESKKYSSEEIVSITYPPTEKDTTTVIYESVKAMKRMPNLWNKNPKPYKEPIFLRMVYEGKHVKGYAMPVFDATYGRTMSSYNYTWRYFYKTEGNEIAVAYWDDVNGIIPGMKKLMKFLFRDFPEIKEMIDEGTLKPKDFRDNCLIILPIIDEILEQRSLKP